MKTNNKQNNNQPAFTLIELLVVIAIIGILTALAVVSLQNSRRSARDVKRIADVKQLQIALELYYQDNNTYPTTLTSGETLSSNSVTYMETIPYPPATLDGDCSTSSYIYSTSNNNTYYNINFCLSNNVGSLPSGEVIASPRGLGEWTCGEYLLDTRDYQSYTTIQLGNQCWMSENLNVGEVIANTANQSDNSIIEKYCYENSESYCDIYGGLYQWDETVQYEYEEVNIKGICPDGWHVPSDAEWTSFSGIINSNPNYRCEGLNNAIAKAISSSNYWIYDSRTCVSGNNTSTNNTSGFNSLPAGYTNPGYAHLNDTADFWSSSINAGDNNLAWDRLIYLASYELVRTTHSRLFGFSVRCLKD